MGKNPKNTNEAAPTAPQVTTETREPKQTLHVVVREGHRVSSETYVDPNDPKAQKELEFWRLVANNYSWGEPVEIVQYDNRIHRVFNQ